jgi:hypothetical protein
MRPQRSSSGSAFVTDTEKRHIMTNSHVVSHRSVCAPCCRQDCLAKKILPAFDALASMPRMPANEVPRLPSVKHTEVMSGCFCMQISNATTVHVRRPGNPKKWRARILCEGIICDLALLTVDEDEFWSGDLMSLQFVDVPELQVA